MFTDGVTLSDSDGKQKDIGKLGVIEDVVWVGFEVSHDGITISEPGIKCLDYCQSTRKYVEGLLLLF